MGKAVSNTKPKEPLEDIVSIVPFPLLGDIVGMSTEPNVRSIAACCLSTHGFLIRYFVSIVSTPVFAVGLSTMFNSTNDAPVTFLLVSRQSEFTHNG